MTRAELVNIIKQKQSFLCVGLDTDIEKLPEGLPKTVEGVIAFNKAIIEATHDLAAAYKINTAFYECLGVEGWKAMEETLKLIPADCFTIADAKRGDIGNTSKMYARAFLKNMDYHSITVAPYMGEDSVKPFMEYDDKWVILLALTSNAGSLDFQFLESNSKPLFNHVLEKSSQWGTPENLMYVVGATRGEMIGEVRKIVPDHFFLVPGVGKQGGSLEDVVEYGFNYDCGLLVNSSRGIIYASQGADFAEKAREAAQELQKDMQKCLIDRNFR